MSVEKKEPRKYQTELVEYVTKRNAVIYLPTGAGKTFIAILAIKRFSHELQNSIENGGKRAIFMCNTVELARQQAIELRKCLNLRVGFYTGDRGVDNWKISKWIEEIEKNQVLVGTAQVFLDVVLKNYMKVTDLSVVVIDECHHALKNHPMHEFLRTFQNVDPTKSPRVIGLSGVLITGNKLGNVINDLNSLEMTFRGKIVTIRNEDYHNVYLYSTKPNEEIIFYSTNGHRFNFVDKITAKVNQLITCVTNWDIGNIPAKLSKGLMSLREPNKKKFIINLLKDFIYQMETYGLYAASIAILSPIVEFEIKKRSAETLALRKIYRFCITYCEDILHLIKTKLIEFNEDNVNSDYHTEECILNYSTEKLCAFLAYIKKKFSNKKREDVCCLIFVERRYTAKCLYYILKKFVELKPELSSVVYPEFMVGRNVISQDVEAILDRKWNKTAIQKFRDKECNVIICSSVLEEGIDVQACNYVMVLDPIKSFNSYIQTKGRSRTANATYSILVSSSDEYSTVEKIKNYKKSHELIKTYLQTRVLGDEDPEESEVSKHFEDVIKTFVTAGGAQLTANNSLRTLACYCQSLPGDAFGYLNPRFELDSKNDKGCIVSLNLPMQSTIKETIKSDAMINTRWGKMSAAFKACVKLYNSGELSERLNPISKKDVLANIADTLFSHWDKYNDKVTNRVNKNKNIRLVNRLCPEELYNSVPSAGERCYAYEIKYIPQFDENDYNAHILQMLKGRKTLAILMRKKLPHLAEMPLFINQGQINVKINHKPIIIDSLTEEELKLICQHQIMLTRQILECWNPFYVIDNRNKENSFLIVPITEKEINWEIIKRFQSLAPVRSYSVEERRKQNYKPMDYLGNIVTKWYDGAGTSFVVTKVYTSLTPLSKFEDDSYENYAEYMDQKYSQNIGQVANHDQFLIEVKELTKRRNFFSNAVGKTTNVNKSARKTVLIPELCHNYEYPADLWFKILLLPSILHRLTTMLHGEALRIRFNSFLGFGNLPEFTTNYVPKPLEIDVSLKRAVDSEGNIMDEMQTSKKSLCQVPTKEKLKLNKQFKLSEDCGWKEYLEPTDFNRFLTELYPVEVDYIYKFSSGLCIELEKCIIHDDEIWSKSQLEMSFTPCSVANTLKKNTDMLSIADVPLDEKQRIKILEKSIGTAELESAEQCDFVAALTTSCANDVFDMERFEMLGDSFLKLSASIYLVNRYPKWHEGFLTEVKSKLVSNRNLLYCMLNTDIPERIQSSQIRKPKYDWLPPIVCLPYNILDVLTKEDGIIKSFTSADLYDLVLCESEITNGICSNDNFERFIQSCKTNNVLSFDEDNEVNYLINKITLQDKIIADTFESILGVIIKSYGIHCGFKALEYFGLFKKDLDKPLSSFLDLQLSSRQLRTDIPSNEVDGFLINYQSLEKNLNYKFKDRAYLLQALTHPSYPTNRLTGCYQELEFIGDAILDFLVTAYIFERFKTMTPGMLTDMRSALVNNVTLACICVRHRFHLFLLVENSPLTESIKVFEDFQKTQNYYVTDQVRILSEEIIDSSYSDSSNTTKLNISENVDVPKALGDIVEALIAAVYLDSRDLKTTWNVVYHLLAHEINAFSQNVPIDPVRELYEHKYASPKFSNVLNGEDVVLVVCEFTCLDRLITVNGFGKNAKQAKKSAAKLALKVLEKYTS